MAVEALDVAGLFAGGVGEVASTASMRAAAHFIVVVVFMLFSHLFVMRAELLALHGT